LRGIDAQTVQGTATEASESACANTTRMSASTTARIVHAEVVATAAAADGGDAQPHGSIADHMANVDATVQAVYVAVRSPEDTRNMRSRLEQQATTIQELQEQLGVEASYSAGVADAADHNASEWRRERRITTALRAELDALKAQRTHVQGGHM
jgi:hypothetical protein